MPFEQARPVWCSEPQTLNDFLGFYCPVSVASETAAVLHIAAINDYRLWLNGDFAAHGPARCGHDHARIDEIALQLPAGTNHLAIEVAAYHMNSYEHTDQPGMLCFELLADAQVLAASDRDLRLRRMTERLRGMQRYSFQRPTAEAWRLDAAAADWRLGFDDELLPVDYVNGYTFHERHAPLPEYPQVEGALHSSWRCSYQNTDDFRRGRELSGIGEQLKGCAEDQLELHVLQLMSGCASAHCDPLDPAQLGTGDALLYDLQRNYSGFIQLDCHCSEATRIVITFDERLTDEGDVNWRRMDCLNALHFELAPGDYQLETFAPYTARWLKVHVYSGGCSITRCGMRRYENAAMFIGDQLPADPELQGISIAAQHTIAQNSVDIFTDCPSRERAGWLCDSFFMGRYERTLVDNAGVEYDFLENFLLSDSFAHLPQGMLPMCYPADFYNGHFIPQWSLWYVLELDEYLQQHAGSPLRELARPRLQALLAWFAGYENDDGLLEGMPGWNFVEWSHANQLVQDVNYPSNMLYARALLAADRIGGTDTYAEKAAQLRRTIIAQSWDGEWFHDHALRSDAGALQVQEAVTEVCQYYALFFDLRPDGWQTLWQRLQDHFGSRYDSDGAFKHIYPANAFIGYVLRIDLMSRIGSPQQCLEEIKGLYGGMAAMTGTLWEHKDTSASCNHGFAGYIALMIQQLTAEQA